MGTLPSASQLHIVLHLQHVSVLLLRPGAPSQCGPATGGGPPGWMYSDWRPPGPAPASAARPGCLDSAQSNGYAEHPSSPVPAGLPPLKRKDKSQTLSISGLIWLIRLVNRSESLYQIYVGNRHFHHTPQKTMPKVLIYQYIFTFHFTNNYPSSVTILSPEIASISSFPDFCIFPRSAVLT